MTVAHDQRHQVQQATDIVRLIGEQVSLRPKGKEFVGLCPFHDDKNPSMYVSPAKQIFKCFACGAGGSAFDFVMRYHRMEFREALAYLAERAGIPLERGPRGTGASDQEPTDRQRIAAANSQAAAFFRTAYHHPDQGRAAREYVQQRGIAPEMVQAFQIGYAPDRWDALALTAASKGWDLRSLQMAGLISPRDKNQPSSGNTQKSFYDRFRHRLIFPIFDAIGRPIAFGGRKLRSEDEPKYLNSPETPLFNKSATLYGLHLAKKPIIDARTAVIVEGYTDVIACHQAGLTNVVATLGTALTAQHVRELRRYAEQVILVFDADAAGQKAADRAVELFLTGDLDVSIAVLPGGVDPADLLARPDGLSLWQQALASARDALSYQFDRVRQQMQATTTVTGRQRLVEGYLGQLTQLGLTQIGPIRRALVVQRLSSLLDLGEPEVSRILQRLGSQPVRPAQPVQPAPAPAARTGPIGQNVADGEPRHRLKAIELAERQLIGSLVRCNELFHRVLPDGRTLDEALSPAEMVTPAGARLYQRVYERLGKGEGLTLVDLLGDLAQEQEPGLLSDLATQADADVDQAAGDDPQQIEALLVTAAEAILSHHQEQAYHQTRRALREPGADQALLMRRLIEHRRENPSPIRIARLRD